MITFNLKCYTYWGQNVFLQIDGNTLPMTYTADSIWQCSYEPSSRTTTYAYYVLNPEQTRFIESPECRQLPKLPADAQIFDTFRYPSTARVFRTTPFTEALCAHHTEKLPKTGQNETLLIINTPAVEPGQGVGLIGSTQKMGSWDPQRLLPMQAADNADWFIKLKSNELHDAEYKFVVYDTKTGDIVRWENGCNRQATAISGATVLSDDFRQDFHWKGAGTAIPIFSLRSNDDWGVGEFHDLKQMVDWAHVTAQKIIQILPVNDTTNTKTDADSYPYSAISVYALHPMYLHPAAIGRLNDAKANAKFDKRRKQLNAKTFVDYAQVNELKWEYINLIFKQEKEKTFATTEYKKFFADNSHWLVPYAVFCVLRDQHGTADFRRWDAMAVYDEKAVQRFATQHQSQTELHYFVQFHLAQQLTEARDYAHKHGIALKGDLPIGISPNSVDAWMYPHLFHLDKQAGAPPDDFSVIGQNWGFPTYNWDEMEKDGFAWWKRRFMNMANYFDAYRIDHILGFFRIWEIPQSAVWGLLGYFNPAMPMCVGEIENYGLHFDTERMLKPYITEQMLTELFGQQAATITQKYFDRTENGKFRFKPEFDTQRKLLEQFGDKERTLRDKLLELHTEVLFIEDMYQQGKFHPRIMVHKSRTFAALSENERQIMAHIHDDYYYRRQNEFWRIQALRKLPALLRTTNMLVCGEDLGMMPACVPQVMSDMQILSLEIQRMPKDINSEFVNPAHTPYLSVCSTGTHDTSPIRSWWHENPETTQHYYNNMLHAEGKAPESCTPVIAEQIVAEQMKGNSILAILPLQDYLAMDSALRLYDADGERINDPSNPHHFWCYRMHLTLDELLKANDFNRKLKKLITDGNR